MYIFQRKCFYGELEKIDDGDYEVLEKGHHYVEAKLNEVPIFIRKKKK